MKSISLNNFIHALKSSLNAMMQNAICKEEFQRKVAFNILKATFNDFNEYVAMLQEQLVEMNCSEELEIPHDIATDFLNKLHIGFSKESGNLEIGSMYDTSWIHLINNGVAIQIEPRHNACETIRLKYMKGGCRHTIYISSWFCRKSIEIYSPGIVTMASDLIYKYNEDYDVDVTKYAREDTSNEFPLYTLTTRDDDPIEENGN